MSRGVAAVPDAELYDLSLAQHAALPGGESGDDAGLLRPALTQSLEFDQAREGAALHLVACGAAAAALCAGALYAC